MISHLADNLYQVRHIERTLVTRYYLLTEEMLKTLSLLFFLTLTQFGIC